MLNFGKKFKFGKIAVNEEEDEKEDAGEQVRFAPQITEEKNADALPSMDFDEEEEDGPYEAFDARPLEVEHLPDNSAVEEVFPEEEGPEEAYSEAEEEEPLPDEDTASAEPEEDGEPEEPEEPEEPAEEDHAEPGGEDRQDAGFAVAADLPEDEEDAAAEDARAQELYLGLRALGFSEQVYGLYGTRMMLSCPDEDGTVYLFEDNGTYIHTQAEDCAAYVRVRGAEGSFRGKTYKTEDIEYLLKEKTFPISAFVRAKDEYDLAIKDGYLPYQQTGQSIQMIKPMSLYRMKDLALRVEYADGENCSESDEFLVNFDRALIEETDGSKQFQRICRIAAEKLMHKQQPFFMLQVLKKSKNLALAFPMDGKPRIGDRFAGGIITDLAENDDGTFVMRIGSDENVTLPLKEGKTSRGQHYISLS